MAHKHNPVILLFGHRNIKECWRNLLTVWLTLQFSVIQIMISHLFYTLMRASNGGLGAVLYQRQSGKMRVIGYGSRTLTTAEKNYHLHSGKLEFLALKWAVCEQFRDYLYYAPSFTVYTDNNPLTYTYQQRNLIQRDIAGCPNWPISILRSSTGLVK